MSSRPALVARQIPFATVIVMALGAFTALLAAGLLLTYWIRSNETIAEAGRALFVERERAIATQLNSLFEGPQFAAVVLARAYDAGTSDATVEDMLLATHTFNPQITNIKIGRANGHYFTTTRIAEVPDTRYYTPPPGAAYAVVSVTPRPGGFSQTVRFRTRDLTPIGESVETPSTTNVTTVDWYMVGRENVGRIAWIGRLVPGRNLTRITFATGFNGGVSGTVAVDVGEEEVSQALRMVQGADHEQLAVFDADGMIYGSSGVEQDRRALDDVLFAAFKRLRVFSGEVLSAPSGDVYASIQPLKIRGDSGVQIYAGIATQLDMLQAPFRDGLLATIAVAVLTLLLAAPFAVIIARRAAAPLLGLCRMAEDMLRLKFEDSQWLSSGIAEFQALIERMRRSGNALQNICRFVPEAHVRRIISSGSASVFGERRTLSLLMTDVTGFTSMAERMEPDELLRDMTQYLTELTDEILAEGGIVDKYVGDAIFCYWNGVEDQPDHAVLCCRAALRVGRASARLEEARMAQGRWPWRTRIGLHCGEAVVGNIGSNQRLDFTVIGGAVNLAARIEGLNKFYGTRILTSQHIVRACSGRFLFRMVDRVMPKGVHEAVEIHELVGMLEADSPFVAGVADRAFCARWNTAMEDYVARRWDQALQQFHVLAQERPDDRAAAIYVERCAALIAAPPGREWDGVERFNEK